MHSDAKMPQIPQFLDRQASYAIFAPKLADLGYDPTPVNGKRAILTGWSKRPAEALEFEKHSSKSVGVLCGGPHNLVAVDVDVLHSICAYELEEMITEKLGPAPKRVGKAPKFLLLYRCTEPRRKHQTAEYDIEGDKSQVEFLGEGNQFVASGIHEDTKAPYKWPGDNLIDVSPLELTEVTPAELDSVKEMSEHLLSIYGSETKAPGNKPTDNELVFGKSSNLERIQQIKNRTAWHTPMVELTASLVGKGLDRETIINLLVEHRWDGYSEAETRTELGKMIDGAFGKGFAPGTLTKRPRSRSLASLFAENIIIPDPPHVWLPGGFSLMAGAPKAGKSLLMEHVALQVARTQRVLYLALEYSLPVVQQRFQKHYAESAVRENLVLLIEGDLNRIDEGGDTHLRELIDEIGPRLIVIDTLGRFKRPGQEKGYEGETASLTELKVLVDAAVGDCLCIHHSRKRSVHDNDDVFERVLGSTALAAVPDNLLFLEQVEDIVTLHAKGRLIKPSKRVLVFEGGEFTERHEPGADLLGKADAQANILNILADGPLNQTQIAARLELDPGNVSRYCAKLEQAKRIWRGSKGQPWKLRHA